MTHADLYKATEFDPDLALHYRRLTRQFLETIGWSPETADDFETHWYSILATDKNSIVAVVMHHGTVVGGWNATFHNGTLQIAFQTGPDAIQLGKQLVDSI